MPRKSKKVVLDPAGKDLKAFQGKYSDLWHKFLSSDAGVAGLQFLRNRKLESVRNLSDDQIDKNSRQYLSELRGFLQLENDMAELPTMTDFTLPFEEQEVYLSPEQVEENQRQIQKYQEENQKKRYGN